VPSPETEAHLEGAKNLWRYNRGDLFNVTVWIGLFVVVAGVCWLGLHLLELIPAGHPHPIHYGPLPKPTVTIPPFTPPT
jgi:hypothetical protein